eukprot:12920538-Prorocentrum_lima.AAC.1
MLLLLPSAALSRWFRIKRANSLFQAWSVGNLGDHTIQRALMSDPGEPFAMWDSGAPHLFFFQKRHGCEKKASRVDPHQEMMDAT